MKRIRIKEGWVEAGRKGTILGGVIMAGQLWTPVLWDGEEDPDLHKTAGLEVFQEELVKNLKKELGP